METVTKDDKIDHLLGTIVWYELLLVYVIWQGQLTDGTVFDSSFERGDPIEFELGSGHVIKGTIVFI